MSRIVLIKTCPEIQLAHLYEHLYLSAFVELCRAQGLLNYIDYRWHGKTFHGGFVYIDITLVSPEAHVLEDRLHNLPILFDQRAIEAAASEINAEKKKRIGGNEQLLVVALKELHEQPWQLLDRFMYYDAKANRRSRKVVWESDEAARTTTLRCEVELDAGFAVDNRVLLPLFKVLATALLDNINISMDIEHRYFAYDESSTYMTKTTKEVSLLRVWNREQNIAEEFETCKRTLQEVLKHDFASRLTDFLQKGRHRGESITPDELDIYEACEILVGDAGWRSIATRDNMRAILEHVSLRLVAGKEKQAVRVASLMS